ncbi:MAG TPA: hypothetical protein VMS17_18365 [Gemmataceae bacterium]|nr:hypothetical protein [Gemmataceae bacterium]
MRHIRTIGLIALAVTCLILVDSYGQRGGRGGGAGGARVGGAAVGGSVRTGAAVGPYGGAGVGSRTSATAVGPRGGSTSVGRGSGSYTTQRGTTIEAGGVGRTVTGPGGRTAGAGVGGVQITTPGGREINKVGAARGAVGPNGAVGSRGSIGTATGPNGSIAGASRGGIAVGPNGAVAGGSRIGAATGPGGSVVGASRAGAAVGPNGFAAYPGRGIATGHRTTYVSRTAIRTQGVYVRRSFVHYDCFRPNWYVTHPNAWRAAAWTTAAFWTGVAWGRLYPFCGYPATPIVYDYGGTVVYQDNSVYYNGEPVATAEQYTEQAAAIADQGLQAQPSEKEDWMSLGVFGMVKGEETDANQIFQLAINKDGVLRGNYNDALSDTTLPVHGSVDKRTQRAAWTVGDRKETVYETGVGNLMEEETTVLVHFGKDRTQQWTLIRLEQPEEAK